MWARPNTIVKIAELDNMQYIKVVPNVGMFFPGIDHLREKVNKASRAAEYKVPVVIDCIKFNGFDYTAAQVRWIYANYCDHLISHAFNLYHKFYHFFFFNFPKFQGIIGLAADLHKQKQVLILNNLDLSLHHFICSQHVLFCNKDETLRELLTQEGIRNGSINLMQHIRASIDLGYKVDPLINVETKKD